MCSLFDADGDGQISKDEFAKMVAYLWESGRSWEAALPAQNQRENAELDMAETAIRVEGHDRSMSAEAASPVRVAAGQQELNDGFSGSGVIDTSKTEDTMRWDADSFLGNGAASRSLDLPKVTTETESRAGDWQRTWNGATEDRASPSSKSRSAFFGSTGDWQVNRNDATEAKDTSTTMNNLDTFGSTGAWQDSWGDAKAKPAFGTTINLDELGERGQHSDARLTVESRRSAFQDAAKATLHIRCPFSEVERNQDAFAAHFARAAADALGLPAKCIRVRAVQPGR